MKTTAAKPLIAVTALLALLTAWFCCALCLASPSVVCHDPSNTSGLSDDLTDDQTKSASCGLPCGKSENSSGDKPAQSCGLTGFPSDEGNDQAPCQKPLLCLLTCPIDQSNYTVILEAISFEHLTPRTSFVPAGWADIDSTRLVLKKSVLFDSALHAAGPANPKPTLLSLHTMLTT